MAKIVTKEEYDILRAENGGRPPKGIRNPYIKDKDFSASLEHRNTKGAYKSIGSIIKRLNNEEYTELDKKSLMKLYKIFFNTPTNELRKIMNNKDTPLGAVVIISTLLDEKTRLKAWTEFINWTMGKAPDRVEVTTNTEVTNEEKESILRVIGDKY